MKTKILYLTINQVTVTKVLLHREIETLIATGLSPRSELIRKYERTLTVLKSSSRAYEFDEETLFVFDTTILKEVAWTRIGRSNLSRRSVMCLLAMYEEAKSRMALRRSRHFN